MTDNHPQIVVRRVERCNECGARQPFRQQEGFRDRGAFSQAQAVCKNCGHIAHLRLIEEPRPAQTPQREQRKCRIPLR